MVAPMATLHATLLCLACVQFALGQGVTRPLATAATGDDDDTTTVSSPSPAMPLCVPIPAAAGTASWETAARYLSAPVTVNYPAASGSFDAVSKVCAPDLRVVADLVDTGGLQQAVYRRYVSQHLRCAGYGTADACRRADIDGGQAAAGGRPAGMCRWDSTLIGCVPSAAGSGPIDSGQQVSCPELMLATTAEGPPQAATRSETSDPSGPQVESRYKDEAANMLQRALDCGEQATRTSCERITAGGPQCEWDAPSGLCGLNVAQYHQLVRQQQCMQAGTQLHAMRLYSEHAPQCRRLHSFQDCSRAASCLWSAGGQCQPDVSILLAPLALDGLVIAGQMKECYDMLPANSCSSSGTHEASAMASALPAEETAAGSSGEEEEPAGSTALMHAVWVGVAVGAAVALTCTAALLVGRYFPDAVSSSSKGSSEAGQSESDDDVELRTSSVKTLMRSRSDPLMAVNFQQPDNRSATMPLAAASPAEGTGHISTPFMQHIITMPEDPAACQVDDSNMRVMSGDASSCGDEGPFSQRPMQRLPSSGCNNAHDVRSRLSATPVGWEKASGMQRCPSSPLSRESTFDSPGSHVSIDTGRFDRRPSPSTSGSQFLNLRRQSTLDDPGRMEADPTGFIKNLFFESRMSKSPSSHDLGAACQLTPRSPCRRQSARELVSAADPISPGNSLRGVRRMRVVIPRDGGIIHRSPSFSVL